MLFSTDNQTLDDLNIFGKHGGDSVYTIYNRCATRGGAAILEEMFRYPLADDKQINRRSGLIQYMAELGTAFPFQNAHFDSIEPYLNNTDERTRLSGEDHSLTKKLSNLIALDAETAVIYKGVQAMIEIIKGAQQFMKLPDDKNGYFTPDKKTIATILSEPDMAAAVNEKMANLLL